MANLILFVLYWIAAHIYFDLFIGELYSDAVTKTMEYLMRNNLLQYREFAIRTLRLFFFLLTPYMPIIWAYNQLFEKIK